MTLPKRDYFHQSEVYLSFKYVYWPRNWTKIGLQAYGATDDPVLQPIQRLHYTTTVICSR